MNQTKSVTVVLPCLNEEKTIELVLQQLDQFSRSLENITTEIIVIDGASLHTYSKLIFLLVPSNVFSCLELSLVERA